MTRSILLISLLISLLLLSYLPLLAEPLPPHAQESADSTSSAPFRVLVLFSGNRLLPANVLFDESLRQSLASIASRTTSQSTSQSTDQSTDQSASRSANRGTNPGASRNTSRPVECYGEFMDEVRFPVHFEERMRDLLAEKYGHSADVIVAFASPSLDFCLEYRSQLFPETPIVFAGLGSDTLGEGSQRPGVTGVGSSFDGPATLRLALRLHPRARQVFVITRPARHDLDSTGTGWTHLSESDFQVPFHRLMGESYSQLLVELSALPSNSIVVDLSGFGSSADPVTPPFAAMQRMSVVSPAPIYGVFDPLVGYGLVGAVTTPMDEIGRATAAMVVQVLTRQNRDSLPPVRNLAAAPLVDWRQLRRWGVRANQLPQGTIVRFEPPSFWRQHLSLVVTTSVLFLLQSGLIIALIFQSRRRQRAEVEARRRREELAHMTRVATMGELTASLAHEINQPLAAILSNAQAALRLMDTGDGNMDEIREILTDIAADDQRAGEVIRRMRALLRKGEFNPIAIDVNELVDEVVGLVRGEMILQNVSLVLDLYPGGLLVHGDRVQLQQVLLNLIVNALDAMKEISGGNRKVVVRTAADVQNRTVQVSIRDGGVGVPPDKLELIFQPFHTSKAQGLGLGLSICRSIIQSHGGRIGSRNNSDRGATFWFTLPALEEVKT